MSAGFLSSRVKDARARLGWSQARLAERAGVSRQLVGAVEAGRHVPNVVAAVALARALGLTVEELCADDAPQRATMLLDPPDTAIDRLPVSAVRVGERLVAVPRGRMRDGAELWSLADAVVDAECGVSMLPGGSVDGLLVAGCDPALGILAGLVQQTPGHRVVVGHASTAAAVAALADGRAHAIVVHAPRHAMPTPPFAVERRHLARWQVGLASGRRGGVPTIDEIASRRVHVVQRDPGASTQAAFERALVRAGATTTAGPVATGHIDVARRVADGAAVGITMEAAARTFGLGFAPLEEHDVELWIDARWANTPTARALVDALGGAAFSARMSVIGGYDLGSTGRSVA